MNIKSLAVVTSNASTKGSELTLAKVRIASVSFLATIFSCLVPTSPAFAVTFLGGDCALVQQANAIRVNFCKNLTGKTVDDIHVTFSHPGLPNVDVDYGQNLLFNKFGPAVPPGGTWQGIGGSSAQEFNIPVWSATEVLGVNFQIRRVTASGYWTFNGKKVEPLPEPGTWAMMLLGFGAIGFAMRRSRRRPLAQLA